MCVCTDPLLITRIPGKWSINWFCRFLIECVHWKVEAEVIRQQETKMGSTAKSEAQDTAISIIRLRWGSHNFFVYLRNVLFWTYLWCVNLSNFSSPFSGPPTYVAKCFNTWLYGFWINSKFIVDHCCLFPCSADLQNTIESENYALAAELRDGISKLEAESLAASAKALVHKNAQYAFRLGQKVRHKTFGI